MKQIEQDLSAFGVTLDSWFSEASLVKKGLVEKYIDRLKQKGCVEESEGALWFVSPSPLAGEGARRADEGTPHPGFAHPSPARGEGKSGTGQKPCA